MGTSIVSKIPRDQELLNVLHITLSRSAPYLISSISVRVPNNSLNVILLDLLPLLLLCLCVFSELILKEELILLKNECATV